MKSLFLVLLLFATSAMAIITDPQSNQLDNTGAVSKRDGVYISVKNNSGVSVSDGWVMVFDTTSDDGINVTTTTTAGLKAACVVAANSGTIADGALIPKCQIFGYHSGVQFGNSGADITGATAGEALFAASTAGKASGLSGTLVDTSAEVVKLMPIGISLDNSTTSGVVEAFIDIR